jgi:hypothetical protein
MRPCSAVDAALRPLRAATGPALAGCWEVATPTGVSEEHWLRPRGGALFGVSRTVRGDSTVAWEWLRIIERAGRLVYVALPFNQAGAEFAESAATDSSVAFDNPAHDFPQRITYRRRGNDSLLARIEGTVRGAFRAVDFPFRRVSCP